MLPAVCTRSLLFGPDTPRQVSIQIGEIYSTQCSHFVWPSALVLCEFICAHRALFESERVLELGTGTGICAIVLAKIGSSKPCLTDKFDSEQGLALCKHNLALNKVDADVLPLEWGTALSESLPKANYIFGSDCLYDKCHFEDLLLTVSLLLRNAPDQRKATFYMAYQLRSSSYSIECLAHKWNLTCQLIPFKAPLLHLNSSQVIEIYKIRLRDETEY